jgi:hypothetical protein
VRHHPFSAIYDAGSLIIDLHRKFLFLDFAARKTNIFSRPGTVYGKEFHNLVILTKYECLKTSLRENGTANLRSSVVRRHRPVTYHANKSEGICI